MDNNLINKRQHYMALILVLGTTLFWGISFVSTKIILNELPPMLIAFSRQVIATLTLAVWMLIQKMYIKIPLKDLIKVTAGGFFGIVIYFFFENTGLKYTTASNASMIVAAVPILTLISESIFFRLKINLRILICIFLSVIGVYFVISSNGRLDFGSSTLKGNLLVVGSMFSWVIYNIITRDLGRKYPVLLLTTYQSFASLLLYVPFIIGEWHNWKQLTTISVLNLIYLGVVCSALGYFFYNFATKKLGAAISSAFLNMIPVVTVIFGFIVLGDRLSLLQFAGMILIIMSLFALNFRKKEI